MAEKKAILIFADGAEIKTGTNIEKFTKKAAFVKFTAGDLPARAAQVEGAVVVGVDKAAAELQKGTAFTVVNMAGASDAGLDVALGPIMEAADRRTLLIVAGKGVLAFHGMAVAKGAEVTGPVAAADVIPTICSLADVNIPVGLADGRVLYQVMKDPNARLREMDNLRESIRSMDAAMERDSRAPWDKHDCA